MGVKSFLKRKYRQHQQTLRDQHELRAEVKHVEDEAYRSAYRTEAFKHARARALRRARSDAQGGNTLSSIAKHINFDAVNEQLGIPPSQRKGKRKKKGDAWSLF